MRGKMKGGQGNLSKQGIVNKGVGREKVDREMIETGNVHEKVGRKRWAGKQSKYGKCIRKSG
jgi:hypothetical protein